MYEATNYAENSLHPSFLHYDDDYIHARSSWKFRVYDQLITCKNAKQHQSKKRIAMNLGIFSKATTIRAEIKSIEPSVLHIIVLISSPTTTAVGAGHGGKPSSLPPYHATTQNIIS